MTRCFSLKRLLLVQILHASCFLLENLFRLVVLPCLKSKIKLFVFSSFLLNSSPIANCIHEKFLTLYSRCTVLNSVAYRHYFIRICCMLNDNSYTLTYKSLNAAIPTIEFSILYQTFIQDFRFGGETQHLGGVWGHVPPGKCQIMSILNGFGGGNAFGGGYPRSPPPPCMNPC